MIILVMPAIVMIGWLKWTVARRDRRYRRPFDEMPRPPGWSLQNRMSDLNDNFTMYFMTAIMTGLVLWAMIPQSQGLIILILYLLVGLAACSFHFYRSGKLLCRVANHRLGLVGEQIVGSHLDRLSSDSIRVFHDLEVREVGRKPWNIDHVVLTPAGVFAIETKCRRKPREVAPDGQQGHKVIFDGQQLKYPHPMGTDRHGLNQASNNANWLAKKLTELNGTPITVKPVLVLPGWWVEAKGKGPVVVLNPKILKSFLNDKTPKLPEQQQRAINAQLEERCRIDLSQPT